MTANGGFPKQKTPKLVAVQNVLVFPLMVMVYDR